MAIQRTDILAHLQHGARIGALTAGTQYTVKRTPFVQDHDSGGDAEDYTNMGNVPWPTQNAGKPGDGGTDGRTNAPQAGKLRGGRQIQVWGGEERALRVVNLDWEIAIGVTHNAINDDRVEDIETWARSAMSQFEKHKDNQAFDALNSGAAATNYGNAYDSLSFFNDSHVDPGAENQTAQDNSFALALSLDNYETVKVAGAKFNDSRGQPVGLSHNLIIGPPDLERTIAQLVDNRMAFDTANNEINPYEGNTRMVIAPGGWLDTTAWFLVDDTLEEKPLGLQMRQEPLLEEWDDLNAGDGGIHYFKFHARYVIFYQDWRLALQGNT